MKAEEILDMVMGLMFSEQSEKDEYRALFFPILNVILAECFRENNALRRKKGKESLTEIPVATDENTEIPYETELLRAMIPYGIAANLYSEDDENGITNVYREKYATMRAEIADARFEEAEEEW